MADENVTTPAGTAEDPYLAHTWDELVIYAGIVGAYVKLANDIDALAEYPNGDIPLLTVKGFVDGDGKTINRIYNTQVAFTIHFNSSSVSYIKNTKFTNMVIATTLINADTSSEGHIVLENCDFAGIMTGDGQIMESGSNYLGSVKGCSFNMSGNSMRLAHITSSCTFTDCNIKLTTQSRYLCNSTGRYYTPTFNNCYLEINDSNLEGILSYAGGSALFNNTVLDITTPNAVAGIDGNNTSVSIFNSTHAPNMVDTGNTKGVPDITWLNTTYLQSIGFRVVGE